MKKKNLLFLLCSLFLALASCGDEVNNDSKTVAVQITGSANLEINVVAITTGTGEIQTYSDLAAHTWTKEVSFEKAIAVSAGGRTTDGNSGSMKIQIIADNQVLKEGISEGKDLTLGVSYYH
jgi:hypothetical protein